MAPNSTSIFEFVSINPKDAAVRRLNPDAMFRVRRQAMVVAYRGREKTSPPVPVKMDLSPRKVYETHRWKSNDRAPSNTKQLARRRKLRSRQGDEHEQEYEIGLDPFQVLPATDYAALRNTFGVDITNLAVLGELDVGMFAFDSLNCRPGRLSEILTQGHSESWLRNLPSHYGYCDYLDDAIRCLAARLNQRISGTVDSALVWSLYGKALRSLQNAIESSSGWMNTNVLYASHLLAMYELLAPGQRCVSEAWHRHKTGALRLLESRGPEHYNTSFDRAILRAQAMSVPIESLVSPNQECFFGTPRWRKLFLDCAELEDEPSESAWFSLFIYGAELPGLLRAVANFVQDGAPPEHFASIFQRINKQRIGLLDWIDAYGKIDPKHISSSWITVPVTLLDRQIFLPANLNSIFLLNMMTADKLLAALNPDRQEAARMDEEAQMLELQWLHVGATAQRLHTNLPPTMKWYLEPKVASDTAFSGMKMEWLDHLNKEDPQSGDFARFDLRGIRVEPRLIPREYGASNG